MLKMEGYYKSSQGEINSLTQTQTALVTFTQSHTHIQVAETTIGSGSHSHTHSQTDVREFGVQRLVQEHFDTLTAGHTMPQSRI